MGIFDGSISRRVPHRRLLIGTVLSMFLAEITSTQAYTYVTEFPSDKKLWRAMIGSLWVIDLFHSATFAYTIFLLHHLSLGHELWRLGDPCSSPLDLRDRSVYYRNCCLRRTSLLQVYYLRKASSSVYQKTNSVVQTIIRQTCECNALTLSVALIDAALFMVSTKSWHVIPNFCLVKLYFNSVLVSLNSRRRLEDSVADSSVRSTDKSSGGGIRSNPRSRQSRFGTFASLSKGGRPPSPTGPLPVFVNMNVQHVESFGKAYFWRRQRPHDAG